MTEKRIKKRITRINITHPEVEMKLRVSGKNSTEKAFKIARVVIDAFSEKEEENLI